MVGVCRLPVIGSEDSDEGVEDFGVGRWSMMRALAQTGEKCDSEVYLTTLTPDHQESSPMSAVADRYLTLIGRSKMWSKL